MTFIAAALMSLFLLPGVARQPATPAVTNTSATSETALGADDVPLSIGSALNVKLTSYNAVPDQTDSTPFETASGAYSNPAVIAARSNDLTKKLPFGTIIAIGLPARQRTCGYSRVKQLIGYRVIADAMNPHKHNQIDVLLNRHDTVRPGKNRKSENPSVVLGVCTNVTVRVVGHISIRNIPKTQSELAQFVSGATTQQDIALR